MSFSLVSVLVYCSVVLVSTLLCYGTIKLAKKFSWYDTEDPRKMHKGNIPRLGGISVFFTFLIFVIIHSIFSKSEDIIVSLPILIGVFVIFVSCVVDDFVQLRARFKIIFQLVAALLCVFSNLSLHNIFSYAIPVWLDKTCVFLWILLLINAYNLIDGVDWLCSGLSLMALIFYGAVFYTSGNTYCHLILTLAFSLIGFMVWNRPKAKIFLGDCGSETLGFVIAVIPLLPSNNAAFEYNKFFICLLISAIPTIDVLAAVWRRLRDKRNVFSPDKSHIHHKLYNIGFSVKSILVVLLSIQFLICILCFVCVRVDEINSGLILFTTYAFVFFFFSVIHYINRAVNIKINNSK